MGDIAVICPSCHGDGEVMVQPDWYQTPYHGCREKAVECEECGGTGEIRFYEVAPDEARP